MESTEYSVLVNKYNELVDKHNALCDDYTELASKCNEVIDGHNELNKRVDALTTMLNFLLVDYLEKVPDEGAKAMAEKLKSILTDRLDKYTL